MPAGHQELAGMSGGDPQQTHGSRGGGRRAKPNELIALHPYALLDSAPSPRLVPDPERNTPPKITAAPEQPLGDVRLARYDLTIVKLSELAMAC
jgi:hypothetical protein